MLERSNGLYLHLRLYRLMQAAVPPSLLWPQKVVAAVNYRLPTNSCH